MKSPHHQVSSASLEDDINKLVTGSLPEPTADAPGKHPLPGCPLPINFASHSDVVALPTPMLLRRGRTCHQQQRKGTQRSRRISRSPSEFGRRPRQQVRRSLSFDAAVHTPTGTYTSDLHLTDLCTDCPPHDCQTSSLPPPPPPPPLSPSLSDDGGILDSQQAASCKGVEVKIVKTSAWKGDVDKHTFAYDVTFGPETNQFDVFKQVHALVVVVVPLFVSLSSLPPRPHPDLPPYSICRHSHKH